ncbi:ATP-binding protein [Dolichospermum planctonicum UHCC 0167]|jgi:predicted ATPase|uniref:AAA family ATPase n=1 Tax=Dolichospermum planctonicum TaxID=136072 RepID=UPI001443100F|nr:AAA family ATPase [Dolichospermum planctonicum]MCW9681746.1 ATP-binding protein [Dolichospermum planctonicum UHCC 0167]
MLKTKVSFNNLGVIKQGNLELNDFTLLCGANNTGKTYVMYSLYALLDQRFEVNFNFVENLVKQLSQETVCQYNIQNLIGGNLDDILEEITQGINKHLPNLFGIESDEFRQTQIKLKLDIDLILANITNHPWQSRVSLSNKESDWFLDIQKPDNDTNVTFTMRDKGIPHKLLTELISSNITSLIFSKKNQNCFLIPAERGGLNLFFKELSSIRNRLLHHAQKDKISSMEVLKDIIKSRYAEPISDYIEFLNDLNNTKKRKSDYQIQAQYIQKNIINGKYEVDRYGDIFFLPYRSNNKKMPLHFTSSTVKTLFSLVFYLEHLAQPGDYLMIDEPELSLHPDNQQNLARVLAKLVNNGVKVVLSTHSPYFVRELNNLIMLNKSFIKAGELRQRYGYEPGESLNPEKVSAYLFDQKTIKEMEIDVNEGIIAETFDDVINNLNQSSNDIYYASQEEEDWDNE